ncbi:hypothetical protein D3C71_2073550 [compost metagenome]
MQEQVHYGKYRPQCQCGKAQIGQNNMHRQPAVHRAPALQGMILSGQPDPVQQKNAKSRHTQQQDGKFSTTRIGYGK